MKRTYIYVICWMIACLFLRGTLRAQEPAVVEIHVMPGAPAVVFKYQVKSGETVQVDWGDGKVEELTSPKDALQVIKHSYESYSGAAEGTIVSIKADHLLALEEPKAAQGLSNIVGWGRLQAPILEHFVFVKSRMSLMSLSPTIDFSGCPNLKTLKLHEVNQIILPTPCLLEELEVQGPWYGNDPIFFLTETLDLSQCNRLKKLTLASQAELQKVDLTGCTALEVISVRKSPKLRQLVGIKGLTGSLKDCKLDGNALTFDQLPTWTEAVHEDQTAYAQASALFLPEGMVQDNVVDLSFMAKVTDETGKEHPTTIASVLLSDLPLDPSTYSLGSDGKLVFKKEAFVQTVDGEQVSLATMDVRIAPANDYYPRYGTEEYDPSFAVTLTNPFLHTVETFTVTYKAGDNGQVQANIVDNQSTPLPTGTEVTSGTEVRFVATPDRKYQVDQWTVNGQVVAATGAHNEELVLHVVEAISVEVSFKKKVEIFEVYFEAGDNGSLRAVNGSDGSEVYSGAKIPEGTTITFTATPDKGYKVEAWEVNGVTSPIVSNTITETVHEALTIKVSFSQNISVAQISQESTPSVELLENVLYIHNCAPQMTFALYDMSGALLYSGIVGQGAIDLSMVGSDSSLVVCVGGVSCIVVR